MTITPIELPVGPLPGRARKPTSSTGQWEASLEANGLNSAEAGFWECDEGRFTADRRAFAEVCFIVSGRADLISDPTGQTVTVGAGDLFVVPRGWTGTWQVHEAVRKIYVVLPDAEERSS